MCTAGTLSDKGIPAQAGGLPRPHTATTSPLQPRPVRGARAAAAATDADLERRAAWAASQQVRGTIGQLAGCAGAEATPPAEGQHFPPPPDLPNLRDRPQSSRCSDPTGTCGSGACFRSLSRVGGRSTGCLASPETVHGPGHVVHVSAGRGSVTELRRLRDRLLPARGGGCQASGQPSHSSPRSTGGRGGYAARPDAVRGEAEGRPVGRG